jgi:quercetin dioxygenase-like cupin family protein
MVKSEDQIVVKIIEYSPHAVINKTIIKKTKEEFNISSFDTTEELSKRILPFDIYIQIIEGEVELIIDGKKHALKLGQGIIIPANTKYNFITNKQFKMTSTIIK